MLPNIQFIITFAGHKGEVAEWSNAAVLKTVMVQAIGGSNPSPSAKQGFDRQ